MQIIVFRFGVSLRQKLFFKEINCKLDLAVICSQKQKISISVKEKIENVTDIHISERSSKLLLKCSLPAIKVKLPEILGQI